MRLSKLIPGTDPRRDPTITGLTADSRQVRPGYLFAALPGHQADGRNFIPDAVARGAVAVLTAPRPQLAARCGDALLIEDRNPRRRLAQMAAAFHGAQPAVMVAVTGTNGKTSVVEGCRQIWRRLGMNAASMGTLGTVRADGDGGGSLTTPDPVTLHDTLATLAADGCDHLAIEASSHGLDQYRLDGIA
ncbi:MAG: Mur ligase family protein, partial [Pseudomonadota bacterium]|nr:Mur ligase family protein [Pseudomonadota bacterium]